MTDAALIERVETAKGPNRELDGLIFKARYPDRDWFEFEDGWASRCPEDAGAFDTAPRYTASIDAAMTLVPEGWTADVRRYPDGEGNAYLSEWSPPCKGSKATNASTPALALCAAALRAKGRADG